MNDFFSKPIASIPRISLQAFCEQASTRELLEQALADRRFGRAQAHVNSGGISMALEAFRNAPTPNLIVIESFAERDVLLSQLDALAEICDAETKVVVIGRVNDIILYRELIARGVSEYMVHPFETTHFVRIISELYAKPGQKLIGRMIAVSGVKGGVGASTVAHNLAWSLSQSLDQPAIIVDMDFAFGTAGLDFNQDPPQGIADALAAGERLDVALVERLLTRCDARLSILCAPAMLDRKFDIAEQDFDPLLHILRGCAPYIILDLPHGWPGWKSNVLASADEAVIVASPDLAALRNAKSMFDFLRNARPNDLVPKLVLNGIGLPKRPEIPSSDFAKALGADPVCIIPHDAKTFGTAANNGQMIGELTGADKTAQIFFELARKISGRLDQRGNSAGLIMPLVSKLRNVFAS